jgi:hypothetical protein
MAVDPSAAEGPRRFVIEPQSSDTSVAGASLATFDFTQYPLRASVYVPQVRDFYMIEAAAGYAADGITLIAMSDGRVLRRLGIKDPYWIAQQTWWSINTVTGSDWNAGHGASMAAADAAPLKTFKELYRRWHSGEIFGPRVHFVGVQADDDINAPPVSLFATPFGASGGGGIHVVGEPTVIGSGTITQVRAFTDLSGNGKYIVKDTSNAFSGQISTLLSAKMIRKVGGNLRAMVLTNEAANEISISVPNTSDPYSWFPAYGDTNFQAGDAYEIVTLPKIYDLAAPSCRVLYAQLMVQSGGGGHLYGRAGEFSSVNTLFCGIQPNVDFFGSLNSTSCVWMASATLSRGESAWVYNAVLGTGIPTVNTTISVKHGSMGSVKTVLQEGCMDARIGGFIRHSRVYAFDLEIKEQGPSVFLSDENGKNEFDDTVTGSNITAYLIFNETTSCGGWFGVNPAWPIQSNAPYDVDQIIYAFEVGTPDPPFSLSDLPIHIPGRGPVILNSHY